MYFLFVTILSLYIVLIAKMMQNNVTNLFVYINLLQYFYFDLIRYNEQYLRTNIMSY